jgi:hypothetical protein
MKSPRERTCYGTSTDSGSSNRAILRLLNYSFGYQNLYPQNGLEIDSLTKPHHQQQWRIAHYKLTDPARALQVATFLGWLIIANSLPLLRQSISTGSR